MRILLASIACACIAGCTSSTDDLPVEPGGGGGSQVDPNTIGTGGGGGAAGGASVSGRVCLVSDAFALGTCADTGAGGITVSLGNSTTTTQANGSFSLPTPGTSGSFTINGPGVVSETTPLSPTNVIPVLSQALFDQMLSSNGVMLQPGTGSVLATVVDRTGAPVSGVTATSTPTSAFGPFFDGAATAQWTLNQTGQAGIAFFPGVTVGPATLTFSDLGANSETTVGGVQVIDGGLTIEEAVLP